MILSSKRRNELLVGQIRTLMEQVDKTRAEILDSVATNEAEDSIVVTHVDQMRRAVLYLANFCHALKIRDLKKSVSENTTRATE